MCLKKEIKIIEAAKKYEKTRKLLSEAKRQTLIDYPIDCLSYHDFEINCIKVAIDNYNNSSDNRDLGTNYSFDMIIEDTDAEGDICDGCHNLLKRKEILKKYSMNHGNAKRSLSLLVQSLLKDEMDDKMFEMTVFAKK